MTGSMTVESQSTSGYGEAKPAGTVVLAYSGGLDTTIAIKWLKDTYNMDVVATIIDVGQPGKDVQNAVDKAGDIGAARAVAVDVKDEFVEEYIIPMLKANAKYEGKYPLATAAARPLISKKLVEVAKEHGATHIAHGCTGKGNDQVRFEVSIMALAPDMDIIATAREWQVPREVAYEYAENHNMKLDIAKKSPYSIDENLWGRSVECGSLEDPSLEPPEDAYQWTTDPMKAPDNPQYLEIGFEEGVPVSVDGIPMPATQIIEQLNNVGGRHGVGRIDMVENRLVGIKSHEIYEAPAAEILIQAHEALEDLTLTREQLHFKKGLEQKFAEMTYYGLWFDPLTDALMAFMDKTQETVTGTVKVKLYKGSCTVVGRSSPNSLYDKGLATYDEDDTFNHQLAKGFIALWGLPVKVSKLTRVNQ